MQTKVYKHVFSKDVTVTDVLGLYVKVNYLQQMHLQQRLLQVTLYSLVQSQLVRAKLHREFNGVVVDEQVEAEVVLHGRTSLELFNYLEDNVLLKGVGEDAGEVIFVDLVRFNGDARPFRPGSVDGRKAAFKAIWNKMSMADSFHIEH
jgi:hypothetical protein